MRRMDLLAFRSRLHWSANDDLYGLQALAVRALPRLIK